MGEIADALRRARGQRTAAVPVPAPEPSLRGLSAIPSPAPAPAPALASVPVSRGDAAPDPGPGISVGSVEPQNAAVVLAQSSDAEACRHLALRLRDALDARRARTIAIVSAERGDGKTTVACNLAIALATLSREREVALIDLDLRRPAIAKSLSIPHQRGLEEVLLGRTSLDEVRVSVHQPAIDVFPVVIPQDSAHELLVMSQVADLIGELECRYGTVIVDTPPAPLVPDTALILRHVSVCAPVVRAGKTRARSLRRLLECLPRERIIGWILNAERTSRFGYRDYYYYGEEPRAHRWILGGEAQ